MNLKEFLKPTKLKIILFLFIWFIVPFRFGLLNMPADTPFIEIIYFIILSVVFSYIIACIGGYLRARRKVKPSKEKQWKELEEKYSRRNL